MEKRFKFLNFLVETFLVYFNLFFQRHVLHLQLLYFFCKLAIDCLVFEYFLTISPSQFLKLNNIIEILGLEFTYLDFESIELLFANIYQVQRSFQFIDQFLPTGLAPMD